MLVPALKCRAISRLPLRDADNMRLRISVFIAGFRVPT